MNKKLLKLVFTGIFLGACESFVFYHVDNIALSMAAASALLLVLVYLVGPLVLFGKEWILPVIVKGGILSSVFVFYMPDEFVWWRQVYLAGGLIAYPLLFYFCSKLGNFVAIGTASGWDKKVDA
jgi:hypothetical protein